MLFASFMIDHSVVTALRIAAAHLLARPVMGQDKAGVQACIAINKKDDDRRAALKNAQKAIVKIVRAKEQAIAFATGWKLQPLRSLSTLTQTAEWWHQFAIPTSSRYLLWIMKMCSLHQLSRRVTDGDRSVHTSDSAYT